MSLLKNYYRLDQKRDHSYRPEEICKPNPYGPIWNFKKNVFIQINNIKFPNNRLMTLIKGFLSLIIINSFKKISITSLVSSKGPTNTSPHSASVDYSNHGFWEIKVLGVAVRRSSSIQHSCLGSVHANVLGQSEQNVVKHLAVRPWVSVTEVFPY